ncbi:MAG: T9SS type A sorting domain-containing protein [Bacteroidaceae bacterium]|nr:T9SS type A sorting domain-containing protein [Bacteroidaceae bacterium]
MKKLLTLLMLMVATLSVSAQHIIVLKTGDATQAVELQKFRRMTFAGTSVNIMQTDGTVASADMSDITRIYFGDYTGIKNVDFNGGKELVAYISADEIAVNCEAGKEIAIYNVSGTMVLKEVQDSEGGSVSIANLPKGIYLLRANGQTVKIIKR